MRRNLVWLALLPPLLFSAMTKHGPPYMITFLHGPNSNHSTIGLVILFTSLIALPLLALVASVSLYRSGQQARWIALGLTSAALFLWCLTIQQPYHEQWQLGPSSNRPQEVVLEASGDADD